MLDSKENDRVEGLTLKIPLPSKRISIPDFLLKVRGVAVEWLLVS